VYVTDSRLLEYPPGAVLLSNDNPGQVTRVTTNITHTKGSESKPTSHLLLTHLLSFFPTSRPFGQLLTDRKNYIHLCKCLLNADITASHSLQAKQPLKTNHPHSPNSHSPNSHSPNSRYTTLHLASKTILD
jgi:hypothetical protein